MITENQIKSFNKNGYLVVEDFIDSNQRNLLIDRASYLIEEFQPPSRRTIFTTNEQERTK